MVGKGAKYSLRLARKSDPVIRYILDEIQAIKSALQDSIELQAKNRSIPAKLRGFLRRCDSETQEGIQEALTG